jgi:hypothetical protein
VAPSRSSAFAPAERQVVTGPGTAPTSRPRSAANSAVMSEPERSAASTTTVMCASAAISRLRAGNAQRCGPRPGGSSETTQPSSAIRACSARLLDG